MGEAVRRISSSEAGDAEIMVPIAMESQENKELSPEKAKLRERYKSLEAGAIAARKFIEAGAAYAAFKRVGLNPMDFQYHYRGEAIDNIVGHLEDQVNAVSNEVQVSFQDGSSETEQDNDAQIEFGAVEQSANDAIDYLLEAGEESLEGEMTREESRLNNALLNSLVGMNGPETAEFERMQGEWQKSAKESLEKSPNKTLDERFDEYFDALDDKGKDLRVYDIYEAFIDAEKDGVVTEKSFEQRWDEYFAGIDDKDKDSKIYDLYDDFMDREEGKDSAGSGSSPESVDNRARPPEEIPGVYEAGEDEDDISAEDLVLDEDGEDAKGAPDVSVAELGPEAPPLVETPEAVEGPRLDARTQAEVRNAMQAELERPEKELGTYGKVLGWIKGRAIGLMTFGFSESIQANRFQKATDVEAKRLEDVMNSLEGLGPMAQEWRDKSGDTRSLNEIYSENASVVRREITDSVTNLEAKLLNNKRLLGLIPFGPYRDQFGQKVMAMEKRVADFKERMEEQFATELNADKALTEHKVYTHKDEDGNVVKRSSDVLVTKKEFRGAMRKALDKGWWHRKVYSALEKIPWMIGIKSLLSGAEAGAEASSLPPFVNEITPLQVATSPDAVMMPESVIRNLDGSIWNTVKQYALENGVKLNASELVKLSTQVAQDNLVNVPPWDLSGGYQLHTAMEPQLILLDAVDNFLKTR